MVWLVARVWWLECFVAPTGEWGSGWIISHQHGGVNASKFLPNCNNSTCHKNSQATTTESYLSDSRNKLARTGAGEVRTFTSKLWETAVVFGCWMEWDGVG